jgi:hypothetical protein
MKNNNQNKVNIYGTMRVKTHLKATHMQETATVHIKCTTKVQNTSIKMYIHNNCMLSNLFRGKRKIPGGQAAIHEIGTSFRFHHLF